MCGALSFAKVSHASALHARVIEHFRGFSTIEASSVILKFNLILHVKKIMIHVSCVNEGKSVSL